jgi:hypothetical protein
VAAVCGGRLRGSGAAAPTPAPTPAPTAGPEDLVKAFQEAYNAHDADGVMALLSDEPQMGFGLSASHPSAQRQANVLEFQFETNTRLELSECSMAEASSRARWRAPTTVCRLRSAPFTTTHDYLHRGQISPFLANSTPAEAGWGTLSIAIFDWADTTNSLADRLPPCRQTKPTGTSFAAEMRPAPLRQRNGPSVGSAV